MRERSKAIKTFTIQMYSYDELSEKAKQRVLGDLYDVNVDDGWYEEVYEEWKEKLGNLGYEPDTIDIMHSGFYSQGDGASFTARVDLAAWLRAHKLANQYRSLYNRADEVSCKIVRIPMGGSCVHENTITSDIGDTWHFSEKGQKEADEVEALLKQEARALSKQIYRALQENYEYITSREQTEYAIRSIGYYFTASGSQCVELPREREEYA